MKKRTDHNRFQLEALEPRIMLSADPLIGMAVMASGDSNRAQVGAIEDSPGDCPVAESADPDGIFAGLEGTETAPVETPESEEDAQADSASETSVRPDSTQPNAQSDAANEAAVSQTDITHLTPFILMETLRSANGPPSESGINLHLTPDQVLDLEGSVLPLGSQDILSGTGSISGGIAGGGFIRPGNSPGHITVSSFSPDASTTTEIEIEGLTQGTGYDWIEVTGAANLDGTLKIIFNPQGGYTPSLGDSFQIITYGSVTGEFENWLGTVSVPGQPTWALKPTFTGDDSTPGVLTLTIVETPVLAPGVDTVILSGLDTLSDVADLLDGFGEFSQDIPLIGSQLGDLVDSGAAITNGIRNQLTTLLNSLPRASEVVTAIEGWDNLTLGGFTISVKGVLANYGTLSTDPISWGVNLELSPAAVNQSLEDILGGVFGALFSGTPPTVAVESTLALDFTFGNDSGFFVEIDSLEARASVNATGLGGFGFDFNVPVAGSQTLTASGGTVNLAASVTATPDASVLTGGRITAATLSDIASSTIDVGDAFNLDEAGTLDALYPLTGTLGFAGFGLTGDYAVHMQSSDLMNQTPAVWLEVNSTLTLMGQVLNGSFTLKNTGTQTIIEAANVNFDLDAGPTRILSVNNGSGTFVLIGPDLAGTLDMDLDLGPDLANLTLSATGLNLRFNTSTETVTEIDGATVNLPAGPYYRVAGHGTIGLNNPAASLTGDFLFEPRDTDANTANGYEEIAVAVANLDFTFDDGSTALLEVTDGQGAFVFLDNGLVGSLTADATIAVPGVNLSGTFSVALNDTTAPYNQTLDVNGATLLVDVPAGPYLRVETTGGQLQILAITLTGDLTFQRAQTTTGGENVVTIAAANLALDLGTTASDLLSVTNGAGAFLITAGGMAGQTTATVTLDVPGLTLGGTFTVLINNTDAPVNETVNVGGLPVTLSAPAGPYLQVNGTGATLGVLGITATGDFSFQQRQTTTGTQLITLRVQNVNFDFGTGLLTLTNGSALLLLTDAGMAGQGQITGTLAAFGGLTHTFNWAFNTRTAPVDQQIDWEGTLKHIDLPGGPYNRISTNGPVTFTINVAGQAQSLSAELVLTLIDNDPGPDYAAIGVSSLSATLSAGPLALAVSGGTGAMVLTPAGAAGIVAVTTASLTGNPIFTLSASQLRLEFNNTGADLGPVLVGLSEDPADDVTVEFTGAYFHDYLAVAGVAQIGLTNFLTLSGSFVTLNGNFRIERAVMDVDGDSIPDTVFKIGVEDLMFDIKAGSTTVASFHNGTGAFFITDDTFAGVADVEFEVGMIGMSGDVMLEVNSGTVTPINVNVPTPSGSTNINLTDTEYLRLYVSGQLLLGSFSLPFDFTIEIDLNTGVVEFRNQTDNSLLLSIDPSGAITTGLSFDDFAAPGSFEFVSLLQQLGNWLDIFRNSSVFEVVIPFTGGKTLGEAFDWTQLFLDEIYSRMVSVELQSPLDISELVASNGGSVTLTNAKFKVVVGEEDPVEVTVNGNFTDIDSLILLVNAAIPVAFIGQVVARKNTKGQFVIALEPDALAETITLNLVDLNTEFQKLGFGPSDGTYGDADDLTPEQVGVLVERYDTGGFVEALADLLADLLDDGLPNSSASSPLVYDPVLQVYTYPVDLSKTYHTSVPFNFGGDLGEIASASLTGMLDLAATVGFSFTLGFDLGAGEVPRILSSSLIPVPANGRISEDAHFQIFLNNEPTPINLTLLASATATNNNLKDLADDLNTLFANTTYNYSGTGTESWGLPSMDGMKLDQILYAQKAGSGLAISALNEDADGDGVLGTVDEDANSNGRLDEGEDLDGDGFLDRVEDLNGDGNLDNLLGVLNRITIRSAQDDVFATEMGFGIEAIDLDDDETTTGDQFFQSSSNSTIKGLFIEDVTLTASLEVTTTTPISGSLRFGFVEISTTGGSLGTLEYDGTTPSPITGSVSLEDQTTGNTRFYIPDLMNGIEDANLGNFIQGPDFSGSFLARLPNITIGGLGFSFPLGSNPEVSAWVPDINELDYNPDPYDPTTNNQGIFLTYPEFGNLKNFSSLNFTQIIQAINAVADTLSQLSAFSFLDDKLPFIDISINDMIDYAAKFAELVDEVSGAGSESLQQTLDELETAIETLFDLNPDILTVLLDDGGIASTDLTASGSPSTTTIDPDGLNNGFTITDGTSNPMWNGTTIRIIGSNLITDESATASWDATNKVLTIEINGGVTTTNEIIAAINGLTGSPWMAAKTTDDDPLPGNQNTGEGTLTTVSLKFSFNFSAAFAETYPLQLDLKKLVAQLGGTDPGVQSFLNAVTTLIQVEGEARLTVSASAKLMLDFGLDLTNPSEVHPFVYDTTGVELTAKVLGTDINFSAGFGSVLGISIQDGTVTLDQDGNPETDAGDGDKGAFFTLGLRDNDGNGRHYFDENWFSFDNLDLHMEGGVSAVLPIFIDALGVPVPLGSESDLNGDGYPDNYLVIDIPDLVRIFVDTRADTGVARLRIPGANNNMTITRTAGDSDNFKVVLQQGGSASANFVNNVLTIQVNSGTTTGTDVKSVVEGLGGFSVSFVDDDPTGVNNGGGTVTVSKLILIAPDLASLAADLDLCDVIDQHAGLMLDGIDKLLGNIQEGLEEIAYSTKLPLIGNGFAGAADFISEFRNGLLLELRQAVEDAGSATAAIENAIKKAFWNSLGPGGIDILVDPESGAPLDEAAGYQQLDVSLDCDAGLVVNLRLAREAALVDTSSNPIDFDIGIPGFGLAVRGNVKLAVGFDLKLGFGLNKEDGFFFDSGSPSSDPELRVYLEATIPGLSATGTLAFLQLQVSDDPDDPSHFTGQFVVDLMDPDQDGKLTFAELTSSGLKFKDIVAANLEAVADINLDLSASFGGNTTFPRVVAEFHLDWMWDLEHGAGHPTVAFTNVALDLGTFISDFLGPVLSEIQKITQPVQPIVDIVTARIPVLSDLAGRTITLLDLAELFGYLEPSTRKFIDSVIEVVDLINSLEGLGEGSILIPFGAFTLNDDGSGQMKDIQVLEDVAQKTQAEIEDAISNAPNTDASSTYKSKVSGFQGEVGSLDNFSIPIFDNPAELFNIFTGGTVRLVEWRMPTFKFEFVYTQKIAIYPPLYAQFGGRIGATIDIGFGYDTYGIQKFIASEDKNVLDIFDGFYVIDFDENGNERPELTLTGEVFAGASIDLLIVEAGVNGGLFLTVEFDLNDINDDGRVRVSEIISLAKQDPQCIFNIHGEVGLFLEAFLKVDLFFFSIDKTWRFAEITLFSFDITCPEPVLASDSSGNEFTGGELYLNIGTRADDRKEIDTTDAGETFIVKHVDGSVGNETVEVIWSDFKQTFEGVSKIIADAGQGDDYIDLRGVLSTSEIHGGEGNDTIYLSDGDMSIGWGDGGSDTILASSTAQGVVLWGDDGAGGTDGNDILTAGQFQIEIHGGKGKDTITGSPEGDTLFGDEGDDIINAGSGDDNVDGGAGNDTIEGGADNDFIFGGTGNDVLRGSRGDDILLGGDGEDELLGSSGNDLLIGGNNDDFLNGHGGVDLLIGDSVGMVGGQTVSYANRAAIASALVGIETTGIAVTDLTGDGDDIIIGGGGIDVLFGGDGNDFLYGGNFLNRGDTEVIEEDQNDFFDGGRGNDEIFGDDAMGREGERNTGIAIKSSIFYDNNLNGLLDADETGFAGVTVQLLRHSDSSVIATTVTDVDGAFEFVGLDPLRYRLKFSLPTGLNFAVKNISGATDADEFSDDSDVNSGTMETADFFVDYDETEFAVTAGYTGNPTLSISDVTVTEGNSGEQQVVFNIKLSGPAGSTLNIAYDVLDGSATEADGDYVDVSGILVIEQGATSAVLSVPVIGDLKYEDHEQFVLSLDNPFGAGTITALGTIINDDQVPTISIQDYVPPSTLDDDGNKVYDAAEDDPATFVVTLSNPSAFTVTVQWRTDAALNFQALPLDDAATPSPLSGADFVSDSGVVTFEPGETRQVITVTLNDDTLDEHDEEFFVDLYNPTFAKLADDRGYGIIPDDDELVSAWIRPLIPMGGAFTTKVTEGNDTSVFVDLEVVLSTVSGKVVTVTYNTQPGTAVETIFSGDLDGDGVPDVTVEDYPDYVAIPDSSSADETQGKVVFQPGETVKHITVEVLADNLVEGTEMFFVNILGADQADIARNAPAESNHVTIEIEDDDLVSNVDYGPWAVRFSSSVYTVDEPDGGPDYAEITLYRTPGSSNAIVVFSTADGTATAGADYGAVFRQLVVFEGNDTVAVVKIPIFSDTDVEGPETVKLSLHAPTGQPARGNPNTATLIIQDEDVPDLRISAPSTITEGSSGGTTAYNFYAYLVDKNGVFTTAPYNITFSYEFVELTARDGEDLNIISGTGTVMSGSILSLPIPVDIIEDLVPELSETFAFRISSPNGATLATENSVRVTTINDDDLVPVTGTIFYDSNGNGFQDFNENGIKDVDVTVYWMQNNTQMSNTVITNSVGAYTQMVTLGQVGIEVDPATVTSPYKDLSLFPIFLGTGNYENTTSNEIQTVDFDGVVGISPFEDVGYKNTFTFSIPSGDSEDTGRGGTDDTIFGGPGNDLIDAGAGDDHVVGGHWMTATDSNAPINKGIYDADVVAVTAGLHSVYDTGPIFEIDSSGLAPYGSISGLIWLDAAPIDHTRTGADSIFTLDEVVVNLYDCEGNPVNSVVTTNGFYTFDRLYLDDGGADSEYVIEFVLPKGYKFVSPGVGPETNDSDAVSGGRTAMITVSQSDPTETNVDAGLRPSDAMPVSGSGGFEFDDPVYSVNENEPGYVTVTIVRGNSFDDRVVVVRMYDGTALDGVNYTGSSILVNFGVGETFQTVDIPIIDSNSLDFCTGKAFTLELRDPTGRPLDQATVNIYGEGAGSIKDDDTIFGGGDWDLLLGDSGEIPAVAVIANPASLSTIVYTGGPGKDWIKGGDGGTDPDFMNGQLGNDVIIGDGGLDVIRGGLGDDVIFVELDDKDIDGEHGTDTIVSSRDVPFIVLTSLTTTTAILEHKQTGGGSSLSTFNLTSIEVARLTGGFRNNTFDITSWDGSAFIYGGRGNDSLVVEHDTSQTLKDASSSTYFENKYGFKRDATVSLASGATYHLGSLENVTLRGGVGNNVLDASAFSRDVTLEGMANNDILIGGSGNDFFMFNVDTNLGVDTVIGNGGIDTLDFSDSTVRVEVDMAILSPSVQNVEPGSGNLFLFLGDEIENVIGGSGDDLLQGNSLNNVLEGGPGDDELAGRSGNETYVLDTDNPWGSETIVENIADAGHDILDFSGTTTQQINLNMGVLGTPQIVNANLTLTLMGEGIEEVIGGSKNDTLRGNSNNNILRGGPGADLLDGKSGNDVLDGGTGNDDLNGGAGTDTINETQNTNFTLTNTSLVRATGEVDTLDNIEIANLAGGSSANTFTLTGWTGGGVIRGLGGFDTVVLAADADISITNTALTATTGLSMGLNSIENARLTGGPSGNQISAAGFSGNTILTGNDGDDTITGGFGSDLIIGGLGTDTYIRDLSGLSVDVEATLQNSGLHLIRDPSGLTPQTEIDTFSSIEDVMLIGTPFDDTIDVGGWTSGAVSVDGGPGTDILRATVSGNVTLDDTTVTFTGGIGSIGITSVEAAILIGSDGDDVMNASAFSGQVWLQGLGGNDVLVAAKGTLIAGSSILDGGDGDDEFLFVEDGLLNSVILQGGDGTDTLNFGGSTSLSIAPFAAGVVIDLGNLAVQPAVVAGDLQFLLLAEDFENVVGGDGADTLTGNTLDNVFTGGGDMDTIDGVSGFDTLEESTDGSLITLTDTSLDIDGVTDTLANIDQALLTGGAGVNNFDASAFTGRTTLSGEGNDDVLIGGTNDDILIGGAGNDILRGGDGDDSYQFDVDDLLGEDTIDEQPLASAGQDVIDFSLTEGVSVVIDLSDTAQQTVHATNLKITLTSGSSLENVIGGDQDDTLTGNSLDNGFIGGRGEDDIDGAGGTNFIFETRDADFVLTDTDLTISGIDELSMPYNETDSLVNLQQAFLFGGDGNNTIDASGFTLGAVALSGGAGDDLLVGGKDADSLRGGDGNDTLIGNEGNDDLRGEAGNDLLNGGADDDLLRGGTGNDTYFFDKSFDQGVDSIIEFAGQGYYDIIVGLGLSGVDIDLNLASAQFFYNDLGDQVLELTLTPFTIEDAF